MDPLTRLIHREPEAATDLLLFFLGGLRLIKGAYLKNVRVIPAFAQCGV
jgi:hypothetical protein